LDLKVQSEIFRLQHGIFYGGGRLCVEQPSSGCPSMLNQAWPFVPGPGVFTTFHGEVIASFSEIPQGRQRLFDRQWKTA
jgi:hypothetical protein